MYLISVAGVYFQSQQLHTAFIFAFPALLIFLAGFSLNDYFDFETDKINHPERVLAKDASLMGFVISIYMGLFVATIAILLLPAFEQTRYAWAVLFLLLANYNYVKSHYASIKNAYMAIAAATGLYVIDLAGDQMTAHWVYYLPFVAACFGRELYFDIPDIEGDGDSLAKRLGERKAYLLMVTLYAFAVALGIALYFLDNRTVLLGILITLSVCFVIMSVFVDRHPKKTWMLSLGTNTALGAFIAHP